MAKKQTEKTNLTVVRDDKEEEVKTVNKPSPEEVEQFKEEFEKTAEAFKEKKWKISENGSFAANDVAMFIFDFMKRFALWTKTGWMGMIKMDEEIHKALTLVNENTGLELDYQALEFCAYMLSNPGSVGLETALDFEKIADKYSKIGIEIGKKVEEAREELKNLQYLQERWAASEQGFYLADLEPKEESSEDEK